MTRTQNGYSAGHPWYYVLGGTVLSPNAVRASVENGDYDGCLARNIHDLSGKPEPQRSKALNDMRAQIVADLRADLSRYRDCARELRAWRAACAGTGTPKCEDIHTAISLKHNHIVNDLANLRTLDSLPKQGDLFDLL